MTPQKLTIGTQLKGRTSKQVTAIEDYQPAFKDEVQKWLIKGHWFNFAQIDARYSLHDPTRKAPKKKKGAVVHG